MSSWIKGFIRIIMIQIYQNGVSGQYVTLGLDSNTLIGLTRLGLLLNTVLICSAVGLTVTC